MTEKEHQYYRRCALCDPDLIVCPVCNGSGKVARPSSEGDLLVDEGTYPVSLGRLLILDSAVQGEKPANRYLSQIAPGCGGSGSLGL